MKPSVFSCVYRRGWAASGLFAVIVLALIFGNVGQVKADLTPPDAAALENCLNKIALGTAVYDEQILCREILGRPYPAADWTVFFRDYFSDHVFNHRLWEYLTGPVFWGRGNEAVLQAGLIPVFEELITRILAAHPTDLGPFLASDSDARETLLNAHRMFAHMARIGKINDAQRGEIFSYYISHVNAFPLYWKKSSLIDPVTQPYVAALAAQIHATLRDLLPLTEANKTSIAQALDLQGRYRDIWMEFSVLLYDNNGFDDPQREFIYRFFSLNPKELVVVTGISQNEMLGNGGDTRIPVLLAGVNVFGNRVGEFAENPFPADGKNVPCDLFGTVVAHEDYHAVNANYVEKHPVLSVRQFALIQQAGVDSNNYLRGGDPGFFFYNPQEFLASLANQWFCSSEDMVHLAVDRFVRGNPHGINQALFFAELVSVGRDQTWLYTNDSEGNLARQPAAVTRNAGGWIDSIALPEVTYRFEVDEQGMVTRLWVDGAAYQVTPKGGVSQTFQPGESGTVEFTLRNTGSVPLRVWIEPQPSAADLRGALHLEGRSGVTVNNSVSLNFIQQITIEAWIYPLTWTNPPFSNCRIVQKGYSDNQYRLLKEWDALVFEVEGVGELRIPSALPATNRWSHVAGVYDGKKLRLYVNGQLVGEQAASGLIATTTDPLIIGIKSIGGSDGFVGYLDGIRIWSVGRTRSKIQQGMTGDVSGQSGLEAEWRFDTSGGGSVKDGSGNTNHGVLNGLARINLPDGPDGLTARLNWWTGEIKAGQEQTITLQVDTNGAPVGTYTIPYIIHTSGISDPTSYPIHLWIGVVPEEPKNLYLPIMSR